MIRDTDKLEFISKPSQWVNIGWLIFAVTCFWLIFPVIVFVWKYAVIYNYQYKFHERTISEIHGVFSVKRVETHYFRIKSIKYEKPFFMRLVGLSNITIITSDPFLPLLHLYAIPDGDKIFNLIKDYSYHWRKEQNVTEYDLHTLN